MADPKSKRVMLSIADGSKRLAERAELRAGKQYIDGTWFGPDLQIEEARDTLLSIACEEIAGVKTPIVGAPAAQFAPWRGGKAVLGMEDDVPQKERT
jgi:hypothetical protein